MTQRLDRGITASQTWVLRLNDLLPCSTSCYTPVFKITNDVTNWSLMFTADDISNWSSRYNIFEITLVDDIVNQDIFDGKILVVDDGQYNLKVYNQPCTTVGIDPNDFINTLFDGYLIIQPLPQPKIDFGTADYKKQFK